MANEFKVKKGLIVQGSGSSGDNTILDVQGNQGQLFSITDSLEGTLFSVTDISGIPILDVNSNEIVKIGDFQCSDDPHFFQGQQQSRARGRSGALRRTIRAGCSYILTASSRASSFGLPYCVNPHGPRSDIFRRGPRRASWVLRAKRWRPCA